MIPPPYPLSEKKPLSRILRKRLLFVSEYYGSIRHLARVPRLGMMIEGLCQDTSSQPRLSTAIKRMLGGPPSRGTAWNRRAKRHWTVIWKHLFVSKLCIQESKLELLAKNSFLLSSQKWKWYWLMVGNGLQTRFMLCQPEGLCVVFEPHCLITFCKIICSTAFNADQSCQKMFTWSLSINPLQRKISRPNTMWIQHWSWGWCVWYWVDVRVTMALTRPCQLPSSLHRLSNHITYSHTLSWLSWHCLPGQFGDSQKFTNTNWRNRLSNSSIPLWYPTQSSCRLNSCDKDSLQVEKGGCAGWLVAVTHDQSGISPANRMTTLF